MSNKQNKMPKIPIECGVCGKVCGKQGLSTHLKSHKAHYGWVNGLSGEEYWAMERMFYRRMLVEYNLMLSGQWRNETPEERSGRYFDEAWAAMEAAK